MKDKTKKTWIKIGSIAWKVGLVTLFNGGSVACFSMNLYEVTVIDVPGFKDKALTYWDLLETKFKAIVVVLMISGYIGTAFFLWTIWKHYREEKKEEKEDERVDKQLKLEEKKNEKFLDTISKIMEGKK